jgi:hypothetical protein
MKYAIESAFLEGVNVNVIDLLNSKLKQELKNPATWADELDQRFEVFCMDIAEQVNANIDFYTDNDRYVARFTDKRMLKTVWDNR